MRLAFIPAGEFLMGSPDTDSDARRSEKPQHHVRITRPFHLGVHEVTQEQYERVMGQNPSQFKGAQHPVEMVSWEKAVEFCVQLSGLPVEKAADRTYRLPTEAEWEYACRAGSTSKYCFGDDQEQLGEYAWYTDNSLGKTHPVGEKKPNGWGLYDMHGNVWEWCSDWYGQYGAEAVIDPRGPATGSIRVSRGGGFNYVGRNCSSACRYVFEPRYWYCNLGFRVAAEMSGK